MNHLSIFLGSCLLGGLIGLFPLLTNEHIPAATAAVPGGSDTAKTITINTGANIIKVDGVRASDNSLLLEERTYIPVRLLEKVGATVYWDNATQTATVHFK